MVIDCLGLMLYIQHLMEMELVHPIFLMTQMSPGLAIGEEKLSRRRKGKMRLQISRIRNRTRTPHLLMGQLPKVSKGIIMNNISAGKGDDLQIPEVIPFIDFKRRRKAQKL